VPYSSSVDIIFLLERLESQVATGTGVPITGKVLVDKDAILDLIDQLRVAIPEEVSAAKRINAEGERIVEKAHDEATRIVSRAQEQAAFLIGERGLTETAQAEGRRIVEQAEDVATGIRGGADDYAAQILVALEQEIAKALTGIRKGMEVLDDRKADLRDEPPADDDRDGSGNGQLAAAYDDAEEHEASRSALTR
jgi:cell division septum initiation protein DivIVA